MTKHEHKSIAAALAAAQSKMEKAVKGAFNDFTKKHYSDLTSVSAACLPHLNEEGISVIQPVVTVGETLTVQTIFMHGASGETLETSLPLILGKRDMQSLGSAITYARRYGLLCMSGVCPVGEDDDGIDATKNPEPKTQPKPATLTADQQAELLRLASLADILPSAVAAKGQAPSVPEIAQSRFHALEKGLQGAVDRKHDDAVRLQDAVDGDAIPEFEKGGE